MLTQDALRRLQDAQIINEEQSTAIESFLWQESHEGEHAKTRPLIRFLLEIGGSLLLIGLVLGAFLAMDTLPSWQGALLSLIGGLLFSCFGMLLKRTSFHDLSPLLLLGGALMVPVILFRMYDALTPVFSGMGFWLPLTQASSLVTFILATLTFCIHFILFFTVKSRILSLPVALSWMWLSWMGALYVQSTFPDLTYMIPAPNLAIVITLFGAMVLTIWGLLFNTPDPGSTGVWPEIVGLTMISTLLGLMMLNIEFLTAAGPAQMLYFIVAIFFGITGMYIFARTQRVVWGVFSSVFLFLSIFTGWIVLNAGHTSGTFILLGLGLAFLGLAGVWQWTHRR